MSRVVEAYAVGTRLYPPGFRRAYGADLVDLAASMEADLGGRRTALRLTGDLLVSVPARHLEVVMKRPAPLVVPVAAALVGLSFVVAGAVIGSAAGIGLLLLALVSGTVAVLALPGARIVRDPRASRLWWQLLLAGVLLLASIGAGQMLFDNDGWLPWVLTFTAVISGWALVLLGMFLGAVRAVRAYKQRPSLGAS